MKIEPIKANGIHQTSRDVLLGHALAGVLANPQLKDSAKERLATKAARIAIEAVDELIRLENEHVR